MPKIHERLLEVRNRIHNALKDAGRADTETELLAVSKTKPAQLIREAYLSGQRQFGENYLQEALDKQALLQDLDIQWHFIGPIQSNKTRPIAESFEWVHSVDRHKVAQRLNDQRPPELGPLNICVQVNLDQEASKAGVSLDDLPALVESVSKLPHICVRGLMAIPAPRSDRQQQQQVLTQLAAALTTLKARYPSMDTLSMGMSKDLEAAVAAGSTLVRIGTDIFGARD
ncbi:MAG: YggS family pyridoxal phosphate-dependent enzyme [Cellvibrionaceae bacterium]